PFREATALDTLRAVLERAPTLPRQLDPRAPADLETICLKCLEKDPAKRYASALALAEDLERYLRGEPIEARPVGRLERFGRWCRREPALAAVATLAVVGLVSATVISILFAVTEARNVRERDETAGQLQTALTESDRQKTLAESTVKERDKALKDLDLVAQKLRDALADARKEGNRADDNYLRAHRAVVKFYVRFSQEGLSKVPGLQHLQQELMTSAVEHFKDFLKQKANDRSLRVDVAENCIRVGDISSHLGSKIEALSYYDKALEVCADLRKEAPDSREYRNLAAIAYLNRGVALSALGRHPEALATYEKAVEL